MFERSFALPAEVDGSKVDARFDKGVLKGTLPKLPEAQSKTQKIAVKPVSGRCRRKRSGGRSLPRITPGPPAADLQSGTIADELPA